MKTTILALILCICGVTAGADHVPVLNGNNPLDAYQHDAAQKRYADILTIADILDSYISATGNVPVLDPAIAADSDAAAVYEVTILGQPQAVDDIFRNGTPFGFSLAKFRPHVLKDVLEAGLGQTVALPIDPQKIGTNFAPGYFVFLRRAINGEPAHYIVLGTFAQPVARSTQVGENIHLIAIASHDVRFIVPVQTPASFDRAFRTHAAEQGRAADAIFAGLVDLTLQ